MDFSEEDYEKSMETITKTTQMIVTPDISNKDTLWIYSQGMHENYGVPDLEMRSVPTMFHRAAVIAINEMNAYRLKTEAQFIVGETVKWDIGDMKIVESEAWDGIYTWIPEQMLRLESEPRDFCDCVECMVAETDGMHE
jgi:hypothetical protein